MPTTCTQHIGPRAKISTLNEDLYSSSASAHQCTFPRSNRTNRSRTRTRRLLPGPQECCLPRSLIRQSEIYRMVNVGRERWRTTNLLLTTVGGHRTYLFRRPCKRRNSTVFWIRLHVIRNKNCKRFVWVSNLQKVPVRNNSSIVLFESAIDHDYNSSGALASGDAWKSKP